MAYNQRQSIFVADPIVENTYGSDEIVGYNNLREYKNINVISSFGQKEFASYGDNVSKVKRVSSDYPINIQENCAIYLTKPTPNENLIYEQADYIITSTIEKFNRKVIFDIIKNA